MTDKPASIIFLTPGFPKDESDSTCLPLQQALVKELSRNNPAIRITVVSIQYPFEEKTYTWNGITVMAAGGRNKSGISRRNTWRRTKNLLASIHAHHTILGIISCWCDEAALLGKEFADNHGLAHWCWICGQDARAENRMVKKINPRPTELVALSDFINEEFARNHGIIPAYTIYPGVDTSLFSTDPGTRVIDLLAAGSLIPLKQWLLFIEIVAALVPRFPALRAAICGDGSERKQLEKAISKAGISNSVILTGEIPHDELIQLMQRSKILAHTSSYEGFGMVQAEALFAGAQVVSFVKPVKQNIPGWHITSSVDEMKNKIEELLSLPFTSPPPPSLFTIEQTANAFMQLIQTHAASH
ncbi:MAG: glycosyltransferase [Bacteroidetes bacterium]|nr:glycosyltransferase [Bacteroidota bacterium]